MDFPKHSLNIAIFCCSLFPTSVLKHLCFTQTQVLQAIRPLLLTQSWICEHKEFVLETRGLLHFMNLGINQWRINQWRPAVSSPTSRNLLKVSWAAQMGGFRNLSADEESGCRTLLEARPCYSFSYDEHHTTNTNIRKLTRLHKSPRYIRLSKPG